MNTESVVEKLKGKEYEIVDCTKSTGVFETEQGKGINWKAYTLKVKINGIIYAFKLNKVFNDTFEEMLKGDE